MTIAISPSTRASPHRPSSARTRLRRLRHDLGNRILKGLMPSTTRGGHGADSGCLTHEQTQGIATIDRGPASGTSRQGRIASSHPRGVLQHASGLGTSQGKVGQRGVGLDPPGLGQVDLLVGEVDLELAVAGELERDPDGEGATPGRAGSSGGSRRRAVASARGRSRGPGRSPDARG